MPELPDLEVYVKNLVPAVGKRKLDYFRVFDVFRVNAVEDEFNRALAGQTLERIARYGKEVFFHFENGRSVAVHLMLNGLFHLLDDESLFDDYKKKCAAFIFDGRILLVCDPGDYCKIKLDAVPRSAPDVFSDDFTLEYLRKKLNSRKTMAIKSFLIDQKILLGIGNAYADEILYVCKIRPDSVAPFIPDEKVEELYNVIGTVLNNGIQRIIEHDPETINGEYRDFMEVHVKGKRETSLGEAITVQNIDKKKSYFAETQLYYGPTSLF